MDDLSLGRGGSAAPPLEPRPGAPRRRGRAGGAVAPGLRPGGAGRRWTMVAGLGDVEDGQSEEGECLGILLFCWCFSLFFIVFVGVVPCFALS